MIAQPVAKACSCNLYCYSCLLILEMFFGTRSTHRVPAYMVEPTVADFWGSWGKRTQQLCFGGAGCQGRGREMLAGVGPIGSRAFSMLSSAGSCLTNKRCQEEPGLPGSSVNSQLAQSCSCWKETGNPLSSSASPSVAQASCCWRRKERVILPQTHSHLTPVDGSCKPLSGWQVLAFSLACK